MAVRNESRAAHQHSSNDVNAMYAVVVKVDLRADEHHAISTWSLSDL
jgi:hypothetical protein